MANTMQHVKNARTRDMKMDTNMPVLAWVLILFSPSFKYLLSAGGVNGGEGEGG